MNAFRYMRAGLAASIALFAAASAAGDTRAGGALPADICKTAEESGVTADIRHCLGLKYDAVDKRLNAVYQAKLASLDANGKPRLRNDERRWLKAREAKCAASRQPDAGGTLALVEQDSCYIEETERRVKVLESWR
ncbi:lysozyme inhibitor LprI family protein [Burkholderia stagnalis]